MASQLAIQAGALTSALNYANDAMVQRTLLKFYITRSLGPSTATNQQKMDAVVRWIHDTIVDDARRYELNERRNALVDEVSEGLDLA